MNRNNEISIFKKRWNKFAAEKKLYREQKASDFKIVYSNVKIIPSGFCKKSSWLQIKIWISNISKRWEKGSFWFPTFGIKGLKKHTILACQFHFQTSVRSTGASEFWIQVIDCLEFCVLILILQKASTTRDTIYKTSEKTLKMDTHMKQRNQQFWTTLLKFWRFQKNI